MDIEKLREICLTFPQTTEEIKWDVNLCFMVFEKIFAMVSVDQVPTRVSVKVAKEKFNEIAAQDNFKQAAYLARGQWVTIEDISLISEQEITKYLQNSFNLIKSKLSKKLREQC